MTPKKNERDARGHRRSGPAANDGDKRADSTNDQQFAASADDVEDMDEEQSEDELLAAALFAEDALSDEMLVGTAEDLVDDELDDLRALDSLTMKIPSGIIFGFLGPNGAGKTTTIRLLLGLLEPTAGQARVLGFDTARQGDRVREQVGVLLENDGLYTRCLLYTSPSPRDS